MNPGILRALLNLKERDISYTCKSFLNTPDSSIENAYKSYKNRLTHSLQIAKCSYYEKPLEKISSNARATWRIPYIQSRLAPFFSTNENWNHNQNQASLSELKINARNCAWFIALPVPVVIGRSNCFGFGFSTALYCNVLMGYVRPCFVISAPNWRKALFS